MFVSIYHFFYYKLICQSDLDSPKVNGEGITDFIMENLGHEESEICDVPPWSQKEKFLKTLNCVL